MKAMMIAALLCGLLLPVGAPAGFEVIGAEVRVHRADDSAGVRIVYDLSLNNMACGWFLAEFDGLPPGDLEPTATLILDGKEFPTEAEGSGVKRGFRAFRETKTEGRRALEGAKSVQLALAYPAAACPGAELTVSLPVPRSYVHREEGKEGTKAEFPRLAVRFDAEVEGAEAEVRATFRSVPHGSRLVLRADARSAGASLSK